MACGWFWHLFVNLAVSRLGVLGFTTKTHTHRTHSHFYQSVTSSKHNHIITQTPPSPPPDILRWGRFAQLLKSKEQGSNRREAKSRVIISSLANASRKHAAQTHSHRSRATSNKISPIIYMVMQAALLCLSVPFQCTDFQFTAICAT